MKTKWTRFLEFSAIVLSVIVVSMSMHSCDPPGNVSNFRAELSFPHTEYTMPVYASLTAEYYGTPPTQYYNTIAFEPMYSDTHYVANVELNGVFMNDLHYLFLNVQQGFVIQEDSFNMFRCRIYQDEVLIWSGSNLDDNNSTLTETIITQ